MAGRQSFPPTRRVTAAIDAALVALTACGSSNEGVQVAYEKARDQGQVCKPMYGGSESLGIQSTVEVDDIRFREFSIEAITAGVCRAAAECHPPDFTRRASREKAQ